MISITNPSSTHPNRSGQVPSADLSRFQASRQVKDSAKRLRAARINTCSEYSHLSPITSSKSILHFSDGSVQSETLCPAASFQTSTQRIKVQPSATLRRPANGLSGKIQSRAYVTATMGKEEQQHSAAGENVRVRSTDKDDQGKLPDTEIQDADARTTTVATSTIEPASSRVLWPCKPIRSSSRPSRITPTAAGLLRRPSLSLYRRLAPLAAVGNSWLPESPTSPFASGLRSIKLGIETEFYLAGLEKWRNHTSLEGFTAVLARQHNQLIPVQHPRMQEYLRPYDYQGPYTQWCLVKEESLMSFGLPCK